MLTIYIARHGQDEDNARGILNGHRSTSLTTIGEQQARTLADNIQAANLTLDTIYTSPLTRAQQTANIIAHTLSLPEPLILHNLIERDFGSMTGKLVKDIEQLCSPDIIKTDTITYFLSPAGAETFEKLLERAQRTLNTIKENHTDGSILLVTHGDFGKMLYAAFYGLPWNEVVTKFHFGNAELLLLSDGGNPHEAHIVTIEQHNH